MRLDKSRLISSIISNFWSLLAFSIYMHAQLLSCIPLHGQQDLSMFAIFVLCPVVSNSAHSGLKINKKYVLLTYQYHFIILDISIMSLISEILRYFSVSDMCLKLITWRKYSKAIIHFTEDNFRANCSILQIYLTHKITRSSGFMVKVKFTTLT